MSSILPEVKQTEVIKHSPLTLFCIGATFWTALSPWLVTLCNFCFHSTGETTKMLRALPEIPDAISETEPSEHVRLYLIISKNNDCKEQELFQF